MEEHEFKGVWIPREIWLREDLSLIEKAVLTEIDSFGEKGCWKTIETMSEFFQIGAATVKRARSKLLDLELIYLSGHKSRIPIFKSTLKIHYGLKEIEKAQNELPQDSRKLKMSFEEAQNELPTNTMTNTNKNSLDQTFSQEFEEWWEIYLRKDGKIGAFRVYKTAKKKGATKEMLLMAALCYSNRCKKDDTQVKYIMLPSTFLGRDLHWLEWYRNAEQIRQADEIRKTKFPAVARQQIELTPEQQKKNQEAISKILEPLKVKFGSRRV